jgi:hypothetical protein
MTSRHCYVSLGAMVLSLITVSCGSSLPATGQGEWFRNMAAPRNCGSLRFAYASQHVDQQRIPLLFNSARFRASVLPRNRTFLKPDPVPSPC